MHLHRGRSRRGGCAVQWPDFVRFWNVFYWAAHSSNTIIALLALFFIRPLLYQVPAPASRRLQVLIRRPHLR